MSLTNAEPTLRSGEMGDAVATTGLAGRKVVIVNGTPEMMSALEAALDGGHYDIVFVESGHGAYSQIKRVQPSLVILCVHIDDVSGFQVLSMLKLDENTRRIPVLTYTTEYEGLRPQTQGVEPSSSEMASAGHVWMN
jgi:CheY-like chemotaxis protein